jgi:RNA 3'-terminal phosphate cyclase (ATP)
MNKILVDGSLGEGGGQVFRTSLTLSLLTKKPLHIRNIRANRSSPGLRHQHLTSLQAACRISNANVAGDLLGSQEVFFSPGDIKSGKYAFEIPTAGSTSLVLQTIFLPLAFVSNSSQVVINGGTHVRWSPTYQYLEWQWLSWMEKIGFVGSLKLNNCGYYPEGGGQITCDIFPAGKLKSLNIYERGRMIQIRGCSGVSNLAPEIAKRQRHRLVNRIGSRYPLNDIRSLSYPAKGKGTFLVVVAELEGSMACFSALGEKGKRAEAVADEIVEQVDNFMNTPGCVDPYLPDQLLLPLCFSKGQSRIHTSKITSHLITNAEVIQHFLPIQFTISGKLDQPGILTINPIS